MNVRSAVRDLFAKNRRAAVPAGKFDKTPAEGKEKVLALVEEGGGAEALRLEPTGVAVFIENTAPNKTSPPRRSGAGRGNRLVETSYALSASYICAVARMASA